MAIQKHIHKLRKHKYKTGIAVYFCTLPDCNYKIEVPFSLGKESICNICGEPFIMNEYTLRLITPHCQNCGRREVKDSDGKRRYVRRVNTKILATIAQDEVEGLKERLAKIITVETPTIMDEEI